MSLPIHKLSISLSLKFRDSSQQDSEFPQHYPTLALVDQALDMPNSDTFHKVASGGTIDIVPPDNSDGIQMVIIPQWDTTESNKKFMMTMQSVGLDDYIVRGRSIMWATLTGDETNLVLKNSGSVSNIFRVVFFKIS